MYVLSNRKKGKIINVASTKGIDIYYPTSVDYDATKAGIIGFTKALAKELIKTNDSAQIVFITGYSDYIAEGYEVSALHYLTKILSFQ